jgi:hypothetical protein
MRPALIRSGFRFRRPLRGLYCLFLRIVVLATPSLRGQLRKLCEGYFVFKSLGPTRVKGVSEPVNVYEVIGLGPCAWVFPEPSATFAGKINSQNSLAASDG